MTRFISTTLSAKTKPAFALVITLFFVFLIVGMLVALVSFLSVETRVIRNAEKLKKARENAFAGVSVAISELQRYAGPDQRVTATAGLLDTKPQTSAVEGIANPWLTGVWQSGTNTLANPGDPLTWLISGNESTASASQRITPSTILPEPSSKTDTVWLLQQAVESEPTLSVKARKMEIKTVKPTRSSVDDVPVTTGHYAWWIADESVKARINLSSPVEVADSSEASLQQAKWNLTAQRRGVWKMTQLDSISPSSAKAQNVLTIAQLPMLSTVAKSATLIPSTKKYFHDLTTDSANVLCDVSLGGLKLDLSLAFELDEMAFKKETFFNGDDSSDLSKLWPSMRDFYRISRNVRNLDKMPVLQARTLTLNAAGETNQAMAAAAESWMQSALTNQETPTSATSRFSPEVVRIRYVYSVAAEKISASNDEPNHKLLLVVEPSVTLWNPYNVALEFDAFRVHSFPREMHVIVEKRDPWRVARPYQPGDEVWSAGKLWRAHRENIGEGPGEKSSWELLNRTWSFVADLSPNVASLFVPPLVLTDSAKAQITLQAGELRSFSGSGLSSLFEAATKQIMLHENRKIQGGLVFDQWLGAASQTSSDGRLKLDDDSEIRVTIEPARGGSSLYAQQDPFGFIRDYQASGFQTTPSARQSSPHEEAIGYRQSGDVYDWAISKSGTFPSFTHETRACHGVDAAGKPLVGQSESMRVSDVLGMNSKRHLGALDFHLKTEAEAQSGAYPAQMLARFNPRFALNVASSSTGYPGAVPHFQLTASKVKSASELDEKDVSGVGFSGPELSTQPKNWVSLYEIPTAPLLSLGQLQHFQSSPWPLAPGYGIGQSLAHPYVARSQTKSGAQEMFLDSSYRLNEALFDGYFFSSICPESGQQTVNSRLSHFLAKTKSTRLPNPRMKLFLAKGETKEKVSQRLLSAGASYRKIAANLLAEGTFNVNSTSIEAWKAVLASLDQMQVPMMKTGAATSTLTKTWGISFPRFTLNNGADKAADRWLGFRSISDVQLQKLAEEIVKEVKRRGPFRSMADFVNRRLVHDEIGLKGALQAAIDRTDINQLFSASVTMDALEKAAAKGKLSGQDWTFPYPEHCVGPIGAGASGYLQQGDILQALAPQLTVRSDTFKIRAYGDVVNPLTGKLEARAWCEVIVQRLPEFMEHSESESSSDADPPWRELDRLQSQMNREFGRRFSVINVRWLSPEDV